MAPDVRAKDRIEAAPAYCPLPAQGCRGRFFREVLRSFFLPPKASRKGPPCSPTGTSSDAQADCGVSIGSPAFRRSVSFRIRTSAASTAIPSLRLRTSNGAKPCRRDRACRTSGKQGAAPLPDTTGAHDIAAMWEDGQMFDFRHLHYM